MADRYSMIVIDGARELGVFRDAENPTERVDISDSTIQVNSGLYLKDGLHPNKLGQMVFARTISSCIKRFYIDIEMFNN
jgi:lysophospholipase L1-like esterase